MGVSAGINSAERERRRWAAARLRGKRYQPHTPAAEIHLDLAASPKITLGNLVRSGQPYSAHASCAECGRILSRPSSQPMTDEQWAAFRGLHGG